MSNRTISPLTKQLLEAKERIANPDNWCPETPGGRGVDGHRVCALLALSLDDDVSQAAKALWRASAELFGVPGVIEANKRGHAAVMQMYDRAIFNSLNPTSQEAA